MTGTLVEIRHNLAAQQSTLPLDRRTRDAVAEYCRARWPSGTAKQAAREWDLTVDQGKGLVAGRCSWDTFDAITFHKRGGWPVVISIYGIALDQTAEQFLLHQRKTHERNAERLGALLGDWRPMAVDRASDRPELGDGEGERARSFRGGSR